MPGDPTDPLAPPVQEAWSQSLYGELHALAEHHLRGQGNHTLQPTALVHEAYLRLAKSGSGVASERKRFYALAAKVMRSVLVDHARRHQARKRDGGQRLELSTGIASGEQRPIDAIALHDAVKELEQLDPELVHIVDLVLFTGLTAAEAGEVLEVSSRTVERGWRTARAFLQTRLSDSSA